MKKMWCDPPEGWKFGFPKQYPEGGLKGQTENEWLVANGYPQAHIDAYGKYFHCRYWETDDDPV